MKPEPMWILRPESAGLMCPTAEWHTCSVSILSGCCPVKRASLFSSLNVPHHTWSHHTHRSLCCDHHCRAVCTFTSTWQNNNLTQNILKTFATIKRLKNVSAVSYWSLSTTCRSWWPCSTSLRTFWIQSISLFYSFFWLSCFCVLLLL